MIELFNIFEKFNRLDRGGNLWNDLLKEGDEGEKEIKDFLLNIAEQVLSQKYHFSDPHSWNLYAFSRVLDLIIIKLQSTNIGKVESQYISDETFLDFGNRIGLKEREILKFHPFHCEIFSVSENNNIDEILIDRMHWPAFFLDKMLVNRAGVSVSAPRHLLDPLVAGTSALFWCYIRNNRTASDLSHGWGHSSQWYTNFRVDIECEDKYIYNYRGPGEDDNNLNDELLDGSENIDGMGILDRRSLIRNRCRIHELPIVISDVNIFPYDDSLVEEK